VSLISDDIRACIGVWGAPQTACDSVEQGAVRRFAQAIMDDDAAYAPGSGAGTRYGGPIAPPLFPNHMLRRPFGSPDAVQERAHDPDFDGLVSTTALPSLDELAGLPVLNGGSQFEFFRYARHGESVTVRQRYADIHEKRASKGTLVVVVIEDEIRGAGGELLLRSRRTLLRRTA
jgi:hypothetical protein